MEHIVVAVDDSPAGLRAVEAAISLAVATGAALIAVTVLQDHALDERISAASAAVGGRRIHAASAVLRRVQQLADTAGVPVDTVQMSGAPAAEVLAEARRSNADLIVVARAAHRAVGIPHVGSEALRIMEFADVPVLVVPPTEGVRS